MSSSDAPPPVERWVTRSARPNWCRAADESPPPTTLVPSASATASATALRAGGERLELEGAHRAVPEHGAGGGDLRGVGRSGARTDVEAHPAVGHVDAVELAALGAGVEGLAEDEVDGQAQLVAAAREQLARRIEVLVGAQRSTDRVALHRQEREGHGAADEDRVGALQERLEHPDLVGHLGPPDDRHQRPRGVLEDAGERLDLALHEQAGRAGQQVGDALGRRVRAVRGAEGVVDVGVGQVGQAPRQLGVVLGLARLVADVLEHDDLAVGDVVEVRCKGHVGAQQLAQPLGHGRQRELGLAVLRAPEMRGQQQPRAALAQALDRRQRGADACVVGDALAVQRNVEVHPDEDALAVDVEVVEAPHSTF